MKAARPPPWPFHIRLQQSAALATTVQLDTSTGRTVPELIREALSKNAVRVIDLFRDWDEDGNGLIDKNEFYKAIVVLGIGVDQAQSETYIH